MRTPVAWYSVLDVVPALFQPIRQLRTIPPLMRAPVPPPSPLYVCVAVLLVMTQRSVMASWRYW